MMTTGEESVASINILFTPMTWRSPTVAKRQDVVVSVGWLGCDYAKSLV